MKNVNRRNVKVALICVLVVIGMGVALVGTVRAASYLFYENEEIQCNDK